MKIAYIARHNNGGNDEEGAVAFALEQLGHTVVRIGETAQGGDPGCDFALFHHIRDVEAVKKWRLPKAFWCFDLIDADDRAVAGRSRTRIEWADRMTAACDIGFMTDGDWVAKRPGKLHWLPQAADEREIGVGTASREVVPILMTGTSNDGTKRRSFVEEMKATYGSMFTQVERGVHGKALKNLIASAQIVVAPDGPITDRYWSNRVYLTLGCGGFLLHPYCAKLYEHYDDRRHLVYYRSRAELRELIREFLSSGANRARTSHNGMVHTREVHTYRHRCAQLVETVRRGLKIV